jgi:hypothetical protein
MLASAVRPRREPVGLEVSAGGNVKTAVLPQGPVQHYSAGRTRAAPTSTFPSTKLMLDEFEILNALSGNERTNRVFQPSRSSARSSWTDLEFISRSSTANSPVTKEQWDAAFLGCENCLSFDVKKTPRKFCFYKYSVRERGRGRFSSGFAYGCVEKKHVTCKMENSNTSSITRYWKIENVDQCNEFGSKP